MTERHQFDSNWTAARTVGSAGTGKQNTKTIHTQGRLPNKRACTRTAGTNVRLLLDSLFKRITSLITPPSTPQPPHSYLTVTLCCTRQTSYLLRLSRPPPAQPDRRSEPFLSSPPLLETRTTYTTTSSNPLQETMTRIASATNERPFWLAHLPLCSSRCSNQEEASYTYRGLHFAVAGYAQQVHNKEDETTRQRLKKRRSTVLNQNSHFHVNLNLVSSCTLSPTTSTFFVDDAQH